MFLETIQSGKMAKNTKGFFFAILAPWIEDPFLQQNKRLYTAARFTALQSAAI